MPAPRWIGRSVAKLRVRWTKKPDDKPAEGEALVRLFPVRASHKRHRRQGADGTPIAIRATGEAFWSGPSVRTDLHARRLTMQMSVETSDGRRLVGHFAPDAAAPQIDSDADPTFEMRSTARGARSAEGYAGQPSEQAARIAEIIDMAAEMIDTATKPLGGPGARAGETTIGKSRRRSTRRT